MIYPNRFDFTILPGWYLSILLDGATGPFGLLLALDVASIRAQ